MDSQPPRMLPVAAKIRARDAVEVENWTNVGASFEARSLRDRAPQDEEAGVLLGRRPAGDLDGGDQPPHPEVLGRSPSLEGRAAARPAKLRRAIVVAAMLGAAGALVTAGNAAGYRLAPYKDALFKYPAILEREYDGDYVKVDYKEVRDLYQRDIVPEKETKPDYVSLDVKSVEQDRVLKEGNVTVQYIATGKTDKAKAIVVYVHGRGGNRFQGANDGMFGGNFNRIKNLMVRNGGLYLSPGFPDLGERGKNQAKALLKEYAARSPGAPIFVACGSLGGRICWALARDPEASAMISGLLLMGSTSDDAFLRSAAFKEKRFPVYIGHGTRDRVINWKSQFGFFQKIKKASPDYPAKFALFETGSHGTPIRMTDWRLILNWMLEVEGR